MSDDSESLGGFTSGSKERVAYELMLLLAQHTAAPSDRKSKDYWLNLYHDSLMTVRGVEPKATNPKPAGGSADPR